MASTPIVLSAGGTCTPGSLVALPTTDLKIDNSRPFRIKELNVSTQMYYSTLYNQCDFSGLLLVELKIGRFDLTNGPVPLITMGPRYSSVIEGGLDPITGNSFNIGSAGTYNHTRIVFPKPMYVEPGAAIRAQFYRTPALDTTYAMAAVNAVINLSAHAYFDDGEKPATTDVPYFFGWHPADGQLQSQERDFLNTFNVPLHMTRMVGRTVAQYTGNPMSDEWMPYPNPLTVSMRDSDNRTITPMTAWDNLFPGDQKTWTYRRDLAPKKSYVFNLGWSPSDINGQAFIGMHGYREEAI